MKNFYIAMLCVIVSGFNPVYGQLQDSISTAIKEGNLQPVPQKKEWYKNLVLGGYTHMRYNRLAESNPKLRCDQCDKSWGEGGSIAFRRARLRISGDALERIFLNIQIDFANTLSLPSGGIGLNFIQIRDLYFDLGLDKKKEFRIRSGVSKVPYGFEVLQSSQNRMAIDRTDAINSGAPNERDMGVFFYWTPTEIKERFKTLQNSRLKGSGDYGIFGIGAYTGQAANKPDLNDNLHIVTRITYPFKFKNGQYFEPSLFAYTGYFNVEEVKSTNVKGAKDYKDERVGASIVFYPQPLGFQAEYTFGRGPEFNHADTSIQLKNLHGGYVQAIYSLTCWKQLFNPYARAQYYKGGKKHEKDARHYEVRELEMGVEWKPFPAFELTAAYVLSERTFEDSKNLYNTQKGNLIRLQAQFNY